MSAPLTPFGVRLHTTMRMVARWLTVMAMVACLPFTAVHAELSQGAASPGLDQKAALGLSQAVVGRAVGDYTLLDREGRPVRLSQFRGKPLLVSFIYTGCFQVCP
ncbi:MAG: SCO family protein, partial [Rhodoferax sp.]